MSYQITTRGSLTVDARDDGLYDIYAPGYWCFSDDEDPPQTITFGGSIDVWQEGLTQEEVDAIRVGGFSIAQLLA